MRYDTHTHLINYFILPEKIMHRFSIPEDIIVKMGEKIRSSIWTEAVEWIYNLFAEHDIDAQPILDHYLNPIDKTIQRLGDDIQGAGIHKAVILLLDLEPNWGPNREYSRLQFFRYLETIQHKHPWAIWFMGANLKRSNQEIIDTFVNHSTLFSGLKIYPSLKGNQPSLSKHGELFRWAEHYQIPIVTHCSRGGIKGDPKQSDLINWIDILAEFPQLFISFAHHGRGQGTDELLDQVLLEFNNAFVDISNDSGFIFNKKKHAHWLQDFQNKHPSQILYASDYPIHLPEYPYFKFTRAVKSAASQFGYDMMTQVNSERFLGIQ